MNFLRDKYYNITGYYFHKNNPLQCQRQNISKCQICFDKIYHLLSWKDITFTLIIFLVLNVLFWLMVLFEVQFIGFFFIMGLVLFIWDSLFDNTENLSTPIRYADEFDNIRIVIYDIILNLKSFRKENPSMFCFWMSLGFFIIRLIARALSGYEVAYTMLLIIFFIPLGFKLLPEQKAESYKNNIKSLFNITGMLAEEELIPFLNKDFSNRDNDLDSLLTDRTADSISTSLISGISTMPSYLDVGDIQNDVQEEDLLPNKSMPYELSSESDSEHKEISFASSHFNTDSSSEDERLLEKDIVFSNDAEEDSKNVSHMSMLSNITSLGNIFVQNIFKSVTYKTNTPVESQNSSSSNSSDFEFLDSEELK